MTDGDAIVRQLQGEGYARVFVWTDAPGQVYPPHTHAGPSAHVVLDGAITITVNGADVTYRPGDRFDVPGGQVHAARVGPAGCTYVVAE